MSEERIAFPADLLLIGLSVCCVLAAVVVAFGSDGGAGRVEQLVIAAAFATMGLLCTLSLLLSPARRGKFALAAMSTIIAVYAAELTLSAVKPTVPIRGAPQQHLVEAAAEEGLTFDERTKREVIDDLRSDGQEIWPTIHPLQVLPIDGLPSARGRVYPMTGLSEARVVYCNEGGEWSIFVTDEHGFRNPHGLHRPGAIELALLGDSFTQGACVRDGEDVGGQLRALGHETINLGVGGHGPLLELATMVEFVEPLSPQTVLWLYFEGNDLQELEQERRSPIVIRYLESDFRQDLAGRQPEVDGAITEWLRDQWSSSPEESLEPWLLRLIRLRKLRSRLVDSTAIAGSAKVSGDPEPGELFEQVLRTAHERVNAWGGSFYVVYLPEFRNVVESEEAAPHHRKAVLASLERLGIPVIDLLPAMLGHPDPFGLFPFGRHAHFNASGYRYVAERIDQELKSVD